jgi:hypothetical protein
LAWFDWFIGQSKGHPFLKRINEDLDAISEIEESIELKKPRSLSEKVSRAFDSIRSQRFDRQLLELLKIVEVAK